VSLEKPKCGLLSPAEGTLTGGGRGERQARTDCWAGVKSTSGVMITNAVEMLTSVSENDLVATTHCEVTTDRNCINCQVERRRLRYQEAKGLRGASGRRASFALNPLLRTAKLLHIATAPLPRSTRSLSARDRTRGCHVLSRAVTP
jgi:hypothetical protein